MKTSTNRIIIGGIGIILLYAIGYGVYTLVQHVNGNTSAQIEARRRMQEASEQADKALYENTQWYRDQMSDAVTIINANGEEVTYGVQAAPCISSSASSMTDIEP